LRKISLKVLNLGINVGDTINIQLVNLVGKPLITLDGYLLNENITIDSLIWEKELRENDTIQSDSSYKLTLPNGFVFNFTIKTTPTQKTIDLIGQLKISCYSDIIDMKNNEKVLSDNFIKKLDIYFTGENPYFTKTEQSLFDLYVYYADNIHESETTIDVVEILDEYLSNKKGEQ